MQIRVTVKTAGIKKMQLALKSPSLLRKIIDTWSLFYRAFIRQRFYKLSRGGGEWPGLAASTLRRRRGGGVNAAILRDTGALFNATQPSVSGPGAVIKDSTRTLGFTSTLGGGQLATIASYHQEGNPGGNLPVRRILVDPPANIKQKMVAAAKKLIIERWKQDGN